MNRSRREFLATTLTTAVGANIALAGKALPGKTVRLGLIADLHHQFVDGGVERLKAFLARMKEERPDAIVQLGDFNYAAKSNQPPTHCG